MRVSVAMPVHNAAWCVTRALDSVLAQTRRPHEIIVCDDASTDGTPDLIEDRYGDAVRVLRLPRANASATRAVGLREADGDWLALMDADDAWRPDKLERQMVFIARHPEVRWISSDGSYESATEVIRESWLSDYFDPVEDMVGDLLPLLMERCWALLSSTLVERRAYHEVGGLDPSLGYSYDWDLSLKVLARYPGAVMADRLIMYFSSPGALSRNMPARYRDNLAIMSRIAAGSLGQRRAVQRRAAERAAALAFDLGVILMSNGEMGEARRHLRQAATVGPVLRRATALGGAMLPGWSLALLRKWGWLRTNVQRVREPSIQLSPDGPSWEGP